MWLVEKSGHSLDFMFYFFQVMDNNLQEDALFKYVPCGGYVLFFHLENQQGMWFVWGCSDCVVHLYFHPFSDTVFNFLWTL